MTSGITELSQLLADMSPELQAGEFVFCSVNGQIADYAHLEPLCCFKEQEGLTLVLTVEAAIQGYLAFDVRFKQITLSVHSSLEAVGLTAAISHKLTDYGISANVIAAYYHDHIFVPADKASLAMQALKEFAA
ncbi:transporter [Shewanella sp. 10N.286.51.B7]|uniref:ACT domain-containing protein n=1 Tax=Shewanella sp. 10N.286.51.B7 TaxID=1880836 RepID=UPI000C83672D|nr:ACT domain-containing protein [Shewanella sp. 10N.286.51.B7]PMG78499.1 transporter [Shewanella sp. 10N.286.51.B7]